MVSKSLNIILADDDEDDCLFFKEALDSIPLQSTLTVVHNGRELHQQLLSLPANSVDVVFLDLNMPKVNGLAALREIKKDKALQQVPIVIFSTSYDEEVGERLYKSGAHYFICKPIDPAELKSLVQKALSLLKKKNSPQPSKENFLLSAQNRILR